MSSLPLAGRRVLVTRASHQAGDLSDGLRALGAEPVQVPILEIQPPADFAPMDDVLRHLHRYHWMILTSANTVRALSERAEELGVSLAVAASVKVAAIGEATAAAAYKAGLAVALIPENYVAESLIQALSAQISGQQILLARAAIARDVIPDALRAEGAIVDVVDAYRNVMPESAPGQLRRALAAGIDATTFTSSSSVIHLADAARAAGIEFPFARVPAISIGPITSRTLRDLGWEPAAEAAPSDIAGLIKATVFAFAGRRKS
ncbi:MAG TPA: uroporphyrinogen-III synthase [Terracidiphilus sp.]|nr:uroporphyrinogen-III synthase [Terracidiphilus sp.]